MLSFLRKTTKSNHLEARQGSTSLIMKCMMWQMLRMSKINVKWNTLKFRARNEMTSINIMTLISKDDFTIQKYTKRKFVFSSTIMVIKFKTDKTDVPISISMNKMDCCIYFSMQYRTYSKLILAARFIWRWNLFERGAYSKALHFSKILFPMKPFAITTKHLKLVSAIFYQIFIFSPNDNLSKTMKNVFYFI